MDIDSQWLADSILEGLLGNADGGDIALDTDFHEFTVAAAYYYSNSHQTKGDSIALLKR